MQLIGRQSELRQLESTLNECAANKARTVVLEGPAGCGKSELLEAFTSHAAGTGAIVLHAAALRSESTLPLGVMRQLTHSASLPEPARARLQAVLDADEATAGPHATDRPASARATRMQRFSAVLHDMARSRLVLIGIDDLQHVDTMSLQYLLYLVGRSRATRLMTVLTEGLHYDQSDTRYRVEFLRQPHFQRIQLGCLDRAGVAELLSERPDTEPDDALVEHLYAITGGNPLLLRALKEDAATTHGLLGARNLADLADLVGEETFAQAVMTCLERGGPLVARVADALAVLGDSSTDSSTDSGALYTLSSLCGLSAVATAQALRALSAAGVIDGHRFRHPPARATVLNAMDPGQRRELHHRAAGLLYADGAEAAQIAPHLWEARRADQPWGVAVLQDAAEELLTDDRDELAIDYLGLAHRACADPRQRAEIRIRTAVVMRRNNPAAAERSAEELMDAVRDGGLAPQQILGLADLLAGNGQFDDAREAFAASRDGAEGEPAGALVTPYSPGPTPYSGDRRQHSGGTGGNPQPEHAPAFAEAVDVGTDSAGSADAADAADSEAVAECEDLLQRSVLTDSTLEPIATAITSLVLTGALDRARHWSELFMKEATRHNASGWHGVFAGLRATVALHLGDLADAHAHARSGLDGLAERKSSVLGGGLIALEVMARTAMGDYEAGSLRLSRPTASSLFRSGHGLVHLRARGHYHLATNRLRAALDDFVLVGQRARAWDVDHPAWIPWRGDIAQVLLRRGEHAEAERLLVEQLSKLEESHTRVRGITLRLLGAAVRPQDQLPLLTRAVLQLQLAGDRLELAHALYDLGRKHRQLGNAPQATTVLRRALQLATECGAEPLRARIGLEHEGGLYEERPAPLAADAEAGKLSDSERRVALLAACGYSNRDISSRLYITVSTVEQHLTRVYRKLRIEGRQQLPVNL
jgi:DNA-binding CsgD family transcriptional regulator